MNQKEFIENTIRVIEAFTIRYLPYAENSNVDGIATAEDGKVRFAINNEYYLYAWLDASGELHIETEYGDDVFVSCREDFWTDKIISFMKFGV